MYHKDTHIHFVGIGGIGMSGIALVLKRMGYAVSGCDSNIAQHSIKNLVDLGVIVYEGNNTTGCQDPSISYVVHTTDISIEHPELKTAAQRGILIHRSRMLAELMRRKYAIAISGAHGKTTTTSLIAHILTYADIDPSYVIGGHLAAQKSNARLGSSDFFVAEADESDRSFLNLPCTLAVVTNIDREHLDTYHDINDIRATFTQFLSQLPFYGKAFLCADDAQLATLSIPSRIKTVTYGISESAQIQAQHVLLESTHSTFDVHIKDDDQHFGPITLKLPGEHNVVNSLAALAVAHELRIPLPTIAAALATFAGIERRFTFRGLFQGAEIFDDYGHHPREIEYTLRVARKRTKGKLIVIFQPHRYTRTKALWHDFIDLFSSQQIDQLFITDIYAASEQPIETITSMNLVRELHQKAPTRAIAYIAYDKHGTALKNTLHGCTIANDLILFLGAGNIYHVGQELASASQSSKVWCFK